MVISISRSVVGKLCSVDLFLEEKMKKLCIADTLEWLLDPIEHRREGRSFALACAYIKIAVKHKGMWIEFRDHFPSTQADIRLGHEIYTIIERTSKALDNFEFKNSALRCIK